jgi:hypothetical protein
MDYQCMYSSRDSGWVVEAINSDSDGEIYRALFTGPEAENRAREYADWKGATATQGQRQLRRSAA